MQGWAALLVHDLCSKFYLPGGVETGPPDGLEGYELRKQRVRKAEGYVSFKRMGEGEWVDVFPNRDCWYCGIL